jgi:inorganic pyrophosphatase
MAYYHGNYVMKVFIEQSGEENTKNVFDKDTGKLLKKVLIHVTYPYPYGYILDTLADDGDNLDCYILTNKKLEAESVVEAQPVGMAEWFEGGKEDHKILAVLDGEQCSIDATVKSKLNEFAEHFFDNQPDKEYQSGEFLGKAAAIALLSRSRI